MKEIKTKSNIKRRFLAFFIDYMLISFVTIMLTIDFGVPDENGEMELPGLIGYFPILFWAIWTIGIEVWFGATLGNSIAGLKPIPLFGDKYRVNFSQSLRRHLLDIFDLFFFGLIGFIVIKNTEKNQRLGDLWAKTIVIRVNES